ncbi:glucose-6-phosphate isomerase [Anaerobacillus sp. MEB173]|uniref:glucose-6-phosphate isomerase n=1 Tax=Anaerobacillus sp. MEB173 TaxID=3383345 RepID=UPI003F8FA7BA
MGDKLTFDFSHARSFIKDHELEQIKETVNLAHRMLHYHADQENDYLGWLNLPNELNRNEILQIKKAAQKIRKESDVLIIIGIGGSYLGARATIEALTSSFYNLQANDVRQTPQIFYAGHHISSDYMNDLLSIVEEKDISINVISKSGTTTEPAIAFRIFRNYLEKKYGKKEASKRIYVTTDQKSGALKALADKEGYQTFVIPDNIGGRYSVFTAVGLLPIAVSGIDIDELIRGASDACHEYNNANILQNQAYLYAAVRNLLYHKGKTIEVIGSYEPCLNYFSEWWKQLFGESEGKDGKGIFPASLSFTTDLHSLGQYLQDGRRDMFETILQVKQAKDNIVIGKDNDDLDELNYLAGKSLQFVNEKALQGSMLAHADGGIPNLLITIPELTPYYFGYLLYFFKKACSLSGCLLGVNPFDQPGVEAYKKNMFALLGKPGYEMEREILLKRLRKNES